MHAPRPRPPSPASQALSGIRTALPLMIAMVPIGTVYGAVAVAKGLSVTEALLMSGLVFAGGAQFVAMDMWTHPASAAALGLAALLVNLRHVLMGASIAGKLGRFTPLQRLAAMPFLTDEAWALAERRARDGGRDPAESLTPAWYFGAALSIYAIWLAATAIGALLGAAIGDPAALGLDFAFRPSLSCWSPASGRGAARAPSSLPARRPPCSSTGSCRASGSSWPVRWPALPLQRLRRMTLKAIPIPSRQA